MIEQYLTTRDRLTVTKLAGKPLYVHEDHRWLLPLVADAQDKGLLPRPCTLVMHDRHHDALIPDALDKIREIVCDGVTPERIIDLCANDLRKMDDDWVIAGIELGLFKHVVIFGVEDTHTYRDPDPDFEETDNSHDYDGHWKYEGYLDHKGDSHTIWITYSLPGELMGFQGSLSDLAQSGSFQPLWDALQWKVLDDGFGFPADAESILLDFDLDCFVAEVRGCIIAWPDVVFQKVFDKGGYGAAARWTGKRFLDALVNRAGIVTVAREHACCGGEEVADEIWGKLARLLDAE